MTIRRTKDGRYIAFQKVPYGNGMVWNTGATAMSAIEKLLQYLMKN